MQIGLREQLVERLQANLDGENCLRPKQRNVQQDMIDDLANPDNPAYGLIKRPTGTGKTANMLNAAVAMDRRTLIIVPRKLLAQQTAYDDGFLKKDYRLPVRREDIGIYDSDQTDADTRAAVEKKFLVTTYASALKLNKRGLISSDPNSEYYRPVVMLDEVHRAKGPGVRALIEPYLDTCYVTGWTATDRFANGTNVSDIIFRGRKRIHETSIKQAVSDGEICSYKNLLVNTRVAFGSKIHVPPGENVKAEDIEKIVNQAGRDEQAIQMYANYSDKDTGIGFRGKTAVCYCGGVDHAHRLAGKFNHALESLYPQASGIMPAIAVSGETPKDDKWVEAGTLKRGEWVNGKWVEAGQWAEAHMQKGRDTIISEYKAGKIKVLCNADLLVEGFDAPNASICFMMVPTGSPIVCEQAGGRVLRQDKNNPDKFAYIVNLVDENVTGGITFGQIAGNMQITPEEMERQKQLRGEREMPEPKLKLPHDMVQIEHLEIVSSVEELEAMRKRMDKANQLPEKTEGWLSMTELRDTLAARNRQKVYTTADVPLITLRQRVEEVAPRLGDAIEFPLADGVTLTAAWRVNNAGHQVICFSPTEPALDNLQQNFGRLKPQYTPWKSRDMLYKDLADRVSIMDYPAPYNAMWDTVEDTLKGGQRRLKLDPEGGEKMLQLGHMQVRAMARRAIFGSKNAVASIYVDESSLKDLADYFIQMGVPPRDLTGPARTTGYFNVEQLVKLGVCKHRGAAEMLLNDLAQKADHSLAPTVPGNLNPEGTLQGAFISSERHTGTFRAYIPPGRPEAIAAWRQEALPYEGRYEKAVRASAEHAQGREKLVLLNRSGQLSDRSGYDAIALTGSIPERYRPTYREMYKQWLALAQEPPYSQDITLPPGVKLRVFLRESARGAAALNIRLLNDSGEIISAPDTARALIPAFQKQMELDAASAPVTVKYVEPERWARKFDVWGEVESHGIAIKEFGDMMKKLADTAAGKTCELVLPESDFRVRVKTLDGALVIFMPEDRKEAIIKALSDYAYGFDASTPAPKVENIETATQPAGGTPKSRRRR